MYLFFLGVVPFISVSLLLLYYWKQNKPFLMMSRPSGNEYVSKFIDENENNTRKCLEITDKKLVFSTNPKLLSTSNHIYN